jgi:hypothetical protein
MSFEFVRFVAEALGLGPDGLEHFYDVRGPMQHRSKVRVLVFVRRRMCTGKLKRDSEEGGEEMRTHHDGPFPPPASLALIDVMSAKVSPAPNM